MSKVLYIAISFNSHSYLIRYKIFTFIGEGSGVKEVE